MQSQTSEAAMAVRDYAFHELGLTRLISLIRLGNNSSWRVAEKVGMRCTAQITRYGNHAWHDQLERQTAEE